MIITIIIIILIMILIMQKERKSFSKKKEMGRIGSIAAIRLPSIRSLRRCPREEQLTRRRRPRRYNVKTLKKKK